MKKCTICKVEKPLNEFNRKRKNKDGLQPHCRECSHAKFKAYYHNPKNKEQHKINVTTRNKKILADIYEWLNNIKSAGCVLCPEKEVCCIDFHHLDSDDKISEVSTLVRNASWKPIIVEINKCILLCSNCHRKVHKGLLQVDETMLCNVTLPR